MRTIYLDTNIYNALADVLTEAEVMRLPEVLHRQGVRITISPVNLLEFLSLGETSRKEGLIWVAQHIAEPPMLLEVEAILVDYAARLLGDSRVAHLIVNDPVCHSPLREEWESVYFDKRRTLGVAEDAIEWVEMIKDMYGLFHAAMSRGVDSSGLFAELGGLDLRRTSGEMLKSTIRSATSRIRERSPSLERDFRYHDHVAFLVTQIFCVGNTPFPELIDEFWAALDIGDSSARVDFVFEQFPELYLDGPMVALCDFASWQSRRKYARGNWFDAYHLQYLQFVPKILTNDNQLLEYCRACPPASRFRTCVAHGGSFVGQLVSAVRSASPPPGLVIS